MRAGPGRAGPKKKICGPGRAGNFGPVDTSSFYLFSHITLAYLLLVDCSHPSHFAIGILAQHESVSFCCCCCCVQGASSSSPSSPNLAGPALNASSNGVLYEHDENDANLNAPPTPNSGGGGASGPSLISPAKEKRKAFFRKVRLLLQYSCCSARALKLLVSLVCICVCVCVCVPIGIGSALRCD